MSTPTPVDAAGAARGASSAFLDHALWKQFRSADGPEEFSRVWLALLCRFIECAGSGVVVLGEPDDGPFAPVAFWPDENAHDPDLAAAAEQAMSRRQGIVRGASEGSGRAPACVAYPLIFDDQLCGVAAISVAGTPTELRQVMRQLQWGAGWIEVLWRRQQNRIAEEIRNRIAMSFDLVATVLENESFRAACQSLVTELAVKLACDQVTIGFIRGGHAEVVAMSHASRFGRRMNVVRDIAAAMDEAIDQRAVVHFPVRKGWDYRVTREHAALATAHQVGAVLTIPLRAGDRVVGALTFERAQVSEFTAAAIELCDAVAAIAGPVLAEKRLNDRNVFIKLRDAATGQLRKLVGEGYFGRKLSLSALLLLIAFFSFAQGTFRVTSDAVLEGLVQRSIVAPFEGFLASQSARAGEIVTEGQTLAALDDRDLTLELLRLSTTHRQRLVEYDRALAAGDRAVANIVRAQADQASAQMDLIQKQLDRTRITAPFDGILVTGDLSQSVGGTVERGQELFKIAPLDSYRVILEVEEGDIEFVEIGQEGSLRIASMPGEPFDYVVERITPIADQDEGSNFFRVEAALVNGSDRIRPGMEGVAKTVIDERLLIRIWTERLTDWMLLTVWRWLP